MAEFAEKLHKPGEDQYGICLRGKAGWGENMALVTTVANAFARAGSTRSGSPNSTALNGPRRPGSMSTCSASTARPAPPAMASNENPALFNSGKCAMWVDATVAGSFVTDESQSKVADKVGFTFAPQETTDKGSAWLYSWALAIPTSSQQKDAAKTFTARRLPRTTPSSSPKPMASPTCRRARASPPTTSSTWRPRRSRRSPSRSSRPIPPRHRPPVPYVGIQLVTIPEFRAIGTCVGKMFSAALTGQMPVEQMLTAVQQSTTREMKRAGYPADRARPVKA